MLQEKLNGLFEVLNSSRFQAVVGIVILHYAKTLADFDPVIANSLIALLATHVGINTVDRFSTNTVKTAKKGK